MGNFSASLAHTPFHAILLWGNQSKSLRVLIDSGADESLLDATLSIPMDVGALDGRSIGRVTHNTTPINLRMSGNHSETIQFLLIKSPQISVVLGCYWLHQDNPLIDWATGAIVGWSFIFGFVSLHKHYLGMHRNI